MKNPDTKELILGIISGLSSILVFWLWRQNISIIVMTEYSEFTSFILPLIGIIIIASLFSLSALFIKNNWIVFPSILVGISTPFLFVQATNAAVGTLLLSILLIMFAIRRIQKEFTLSLGFSLTKLLKAGLPLFLTTASLIVSVFYLAEIDEKRALEIFLPKRATFNLAFKYLPLSEISNMPQETLYDANDILYEAIVANIEKLLGPYRHYLIFASAAAFFFAFKTITLPLYYLSLILTFVLFKIMILGKVLTIEKKEIEVERYTLSANRSKI